VRVAAIDCGTNSIRLLVADVVNGVVHDVDRRMIINRLGEGMDLSGQFSAQALTRTFAACDEYASLIRGLKAQRVRFVATSASRDAGNRDEFIAGVQERLGVEPDVISGEEEAHLSFIGATAGIDQKHPAPYLVVDIGGGSTEFVLGVDAPTHARSVNIGCVRMTERHLVSDPASATQIELATKDIDAAIEQAADDVPFAVASTLVGVAGSVTTVAAIALGLDEYDSAVIHGSVIDADAVLDVTELLLAMPRDQRAAMGVMHPGRVDVIGAGALVLSRIMAATGASEVVVSEHDILDGIALRLAI
jgi:exopolyphosphatase / guanosine-5'-triphosphate,3'-diphosphate pyrophosphatase